VNRHFLFTFLSNSSSALFFWLEMVQLSGSLLFRVLGSSRGSGSAMWRAFEGLLRVELAGQLRVGRRVPHALRVAPRGLYRSNPPAHSQGVRCLGLMMKEKDERKRDREGLGGGGVTVGYWFRSRNNVKALHFMR